MASTPSTTSDFRGAFRRRALIQVALVFLACVVLGGHDLLKEWLVAHGSSRWWGVVGEGLLLTGLTRLSFRNHRCPSCGGLLRSLIGMPACPGCGAQFH